MIRCKVLKNRKCREGGCRNYVHAYTLAGLSHKKEHFMSHREMRVYWDEPKAELFGPLRLMTRWIYMLNVRSNNRTDNPTA
jgi:hypothetical protein